MKASAFRVLSKLKKLHHLAYSSQQKKLCPEEPGNLLYNFVLFVLSRYGTRHQIKTFACIDKQRSNIKKKMLKLIRAYKTMRYDNN